MDFSCWFSRYKQVVHFVEPNYPFLICHRSSVIIMCKVLKSIAENSLEKDA